MRRVAVVGGGISGLAASYYLSRKGIPSTLFERRARLGGLIRTDRLHGCLVEGGPDSWLAEKRWMAQFVDELGLGTQIIGSNDRRRRTFVVRDGRLVPLPDSMRMLAPSRPWQVATTALLGPAARVRMALEWFHRPAKREDRSVADFVRDHFGADAVEYIAQPMMAGVYGAPPERVSARHAVPRFVEYEARYGSVLRGTFRNRHRKPDGPLFLTLRNGMGSLVGALERRLAGHCRIVRERVAELRRADDRWSILLDSGNFAADIVILAVSAREASRLSGRVDRALADLLGGIDCRPSTVAAFTYPAEGFGHALDGFGFLVPRAEGGAVAACTWMNTKFAGRAPDHSVLLRAFMAGRSAEWAAGASDGSVARRADRELRRWMEFEGELTGSKVYRWEGAMPVYAVGHDRLMRSIDERLGAVPGLFLAGNGYSGLGIPDCVRRSRRIAEAVAGA